MPRSRRFHTPDYTEVGARFDRVLAGYSNAVASGARVLS
jgi:hypothetical protein